MLLGGRTKALNKLCAPLVVSRRSKVPDTDCPIVCSDIHGIRSQSATQTMLPNPTLGGLTLNTPEGNCDFGPLKIQMMVIACEVAYRPKLSDPAHGTRGLQPERDGRVRGRA